MRFCDRNGCDNILKAVIKNNKLIFKCNICGEEYDSIPEDTLLVDEVIKDNDTLYKYEMYLKNCHDDDLCELIKKKCTNQKCNEEIVKVIKIDKNGQSLYVCPVCKNKFI